jgi:hypothetical protein
VSVAAAGDPAGHVPELYDDPFRLTAEQVAKLRAYGRESEVVAGAVVFAAGSGGWEMAVVVEGGLTATSWWSAPGREASPPPCTAPRRGSAREPRISVHPRTEVRRLLGEGELTGLELEGPDGPFGLDTCALFLFIGAVPCTGWLRDEIALDEHGFVLTGGDIPAGGGEGVVPLSLETSRPGVFCVGDARSGSVKRVATAIGEGSMAVRLAFERLFAAGRS